MNDRLDRPDQHIVSIVFQALIVFSLWSIVCGVIRLPLASVSWDFY